MEAHVVRSCEFVVGVLAEPEHTCRTSRDDYCNNREDAIVDRPEKLIVSVARSVGVIQDCGW